jgi:serine/threonine-protein kinase
VEVDPGDYIGRPVDDVVRELEDLGLRVTRNETENPGDETEGEVFEVNPSGTLEEGDRVTVSFWGPAPEPGPPVETPTPTPGDGGPGNGNGNGNGSGQG